MDELNKENLNPEISSEGEEEVYVSGNLVKAIVLLFVGFFVVFFSFRYEDKNYASVNVIQESKLSIVYDKENFLPDNAVFRFDNENLENSMDVNRLDEDNYVFKLNKGKVWGNFVASNMKSNIIIGNIVVIPRFARFDLIFDGNKLEMSVYDGNVYLGIISENESIDFVQNEYSTKFLNRIVISRDSRVEIPLSKLQERSKFLLYSKLVKEFKYSAIPSAQKLEAWCVQNSLKDAEFLEGLKQKYRSEIIDKGGKLKNEFLSTIVFNTEENFTLIPERKEEVVLKHLFSYLDEALYFAAMNDMTNSLFYQDEFTNAYLLLSEDERGSEILNNQIESYIYKLSVFSIDDNLFSVYKYLLDLKFSQNTDLNLIIELYLQNIYKSINQSFLGLRESVSDYNKYLGLYLAALKLANNNEYYVNYLTFQNIIFDNFFLRYPNFYVPDFFIIKSSLEKEMISTYVQGQPKDELIQSLINNKIDFLKRLRRFFFDGKVSLDATKSILTVLVREINELMPVSNKEVAVLQLFETELKDLADLWGYLNDSEYNSSNLYGANHEARYKVYLEERDRYQNILSVTNDFFGGAKIELTIEDVQKEILNVFEKFPEIVDLKIGKIDDVSQRYVNIEAVISGYPFSAKYDRYYESVKDISAYNKIVSESNVKLDALLPLFKNQFADLAETTISRNIEEKIETNAQRVARNYILALFLQNGFFVELDQIKVVDEANAIYRLSEVYLTEKKDLIVTFDFYSSSEKNIRNLYMVVDGRPVVMQGEYGIDELKTLILAESDFSTGQSAQDSL